MHDVGTRIFVPSIFFQNCIPLRPGACIVNACQTATSNERRGSNTCHAHRYCDAHQIDAFFERAKANVRHTASYCEVRQTAASVECKFTNARHTASYCEARQTAASVECTINRHRDFSFFLDSGAAFIVTPLL